jgi:hypothetical protein
MVDYFMDKAEKRCVVPVSVGELWDKYSILLIKKKKIAEPEKLGLVDIEIGELQPIIDNFDISQTSRDQMFDVNMRLWELEDTIRDMECNQSFGKEFIETSRLIYSTNDKRYDIKRQINREHGSTIMEVKSYKNQNYNTTRQEI